MTGISKLQSTTNCTTGLNIKEVQQAGKQLTFDSKVFILNKNGVACLYIFYTTTLANQISNRSRRLCRITSQEGYRQTNNNLNLLNLMW